MNYKERNDFIKSIAGEAQCIVGIINEFLKDDGGENELDADIDVQRGDANKIKELLTIAKTIFEEGIGKITDASRVGVDLDKERLDQIEATERQAKVIAGTIERMKSNAPAELSESFDAALSALDKLSVAAVSAKETQIGLTAASIA